MASSSDMKQMYKSVKPQYPNCEGQQFAGDSATPEYIGINYDQAGNEIPTSDPSHHANATPEEGDAPNYSGRHYADDFRNYGTEVSPPSGAASVTVDAGRAKRGSES